ncbi:epoxide hydrolase, soluble (sEH) [Coemansia aciculifera]|nr:epoxide hydrolase, soluble (sEH) [Coemansia aciculifera]
MEQEMCIPVNHDDFIHDVAYNFYGTRLATCSSDRCIKIWDWNKQTGQWILNESFTAHDSSVIRLSWAHPEFGQVLASCSLDRTMKIWMEVDPTTKNDHSRWTSTIVKPHSAAIHCIAFAPEYTNLTIATACSDGKVTFYSPTDPVKLDNWSTSGIIEFAPGVSTDSDGPLCLSWCKSRFAAPHMIVIGGSKENCIRIYQTNTFVEVLELDRYESAVLDVDWAPSMGRSYHLIATACSDGHIRIYKFWSHPSMAKAALSDSLFIREGDQLDYADTGDAAATKVNGVRHPSNGDDDGDEEEEEDDEDEDDEEDSDEDEDSDDSDEDDEDDSDDGNRSSAGSSASPRSHTRRLGKNRGLKSTQNVFKAFEPHSELVGDLVVEPLMPVRRVRWNSTGTLLVSSSDDGVARMWKVTINGTWREVAAVTAEKSPADL